MLDFDSFCQRTKKTSLEGFYHRKVLREGELEKCYVLKKLKLTDDVMLR